MLRALALVLVVVGVLASCGGTTCSDGKGSPIFTGATCKTTGMTAQLTGTTDSCSIGGDITSCTYLASGTTLTFTIDTHLCKMSGESPGCSALNVACTGPILAAGAYTVASSGHTVVADAIGGCAWQ